MIGSVGGPRAVKFGTFELDLAAGELRKNGLKVRLQEQPFRLLTFLVQRPGDLVSREELREKLWPADTYVDFDNSLNTAASKLREALGDSAASPRFVETLPRRGYRFIAPLERHGQVGDVASSVPPTKEELKTPAQHVLQASLRRARRRQLALAAALAVAVGLVVVLGLRSPPPAEEAPLRRFAFTPPVALNSRPAISPDGRHIALTGGDAEGKLWVQDLDQQEPRAIEGTEGARWPFWSPDSDFIGFGAGGELKKVSVQGGVAVRICEQPGPGSFGEGSWSPDGDLIVFNSSSPPALYEVPARGGTANRLVWPEEPDQPLGLVYPHFLPSEAGDRVLLLSSVGGSSKLMVQDLKTGRRELLVPGIAPVYSPSGHLVYVIFGTSTLWALPFSLDTLKATGEAFLIAQNSRAPTVATDGTLVYVDTSGALRGQRQLVWLNRRGDKIGEIGLPQVQIGYPTLSPDGRRVAVQAREGSNFDIWVWDITRAVKTRLTKGLEVDGVPLWGPTGKEVAFPSNPAGNFDIFLRQADGSGEAKVLLAAPRNEFLTDWSRDGKYLLYWLDDPETGGDLWYLERNEDGSAWEPHPFLDTPFNKHAAKFSPDGRYVAYVSDESGQREVYVRPFPQGGRRSTVSSNGGTQPRWSRDGKELFYVEGSTLVAVSVSSGAAFSVGSARRLFEHPGLRDGRGTTSYPRYDVSADGRQFVLPERVDLGEEAPEPSIRVVQNWFEEFRDHQEGSR